MLALCDGEEWPMKRGWMNQNELWGRKIPGIQKIFSTELQSYAEKDSFVLAISWIFHFVACPVSIFTNPQTNLVLRDSLPPVGFKPLEANI